jgi:hypothetical protein
MGANMGANVASYLQSYAVLIAIVRPAMLLAILFGLWRALRRATLSPNERMTAWFVVAVPLVVWFVVIWNLAVAGIFQARPGTTSPIPAAVIIPVLIGLYGLSRSRHIAAALDAAPAAWLIGLQVYRVIGGSFVVLWLYGAMPGVFAVPAGFGDVLVGLLAIPVALYTASGRAGGTALAVAWNFLGIADLVNALALGFLTSPGPFQLLALNHPNLLATAYPTVMTPAFVVPLSLILHGISLWQLRRRSRGQGVVRSIEDGVAHAQ